jgi:hypothetical protein
MNEPDTLGSKPPRERLSAAAVVVLFLICIPMLAPGACALFFISISSPPFGGLMLLLWFASFAISVVGVVLIVVTALRR